MLYQYYQESIRIENKRSAKYNLVMQDNHTIFQNQWLVDVVRHEFFKYPVKISFHFSFSSPTTANRSFTKRPNFLLLRKKENPVSKIVVLDNRIMEE